MITMTLMMMITTNNDDNDDNDEHNDDNDDDDKTGGWWPWWVMEAVAGRLSPTPASQPTNQAGVASEYQAFSDIFGDFARFLVILPIIW